MNPFVIALAGEKNLAQRTTAAAAADNEICLPNKQEINSEARILKRFNAQIDGIRQTATCQSAMVYPCLFRSRR